MTVQAESLFRFVKDPIERELVEELSFQAHYDETKKAIPNIVDMPDRQMDLFIRFCLQNDGRLSAGKRARHFQFPSDDEVARVEEAIKFSDGTGTPKDG